MDTESCLRGDVGYRQSRGLSNSALWCRSTPRLVTIDRERCDASTTRFFDEIGDSQSSTSVESEQDQLSDVSLRFDMDDRNQRGRLYVIGVVFLDYEKAGRLLQSSDEMGVCIQETVRRR